MKLKLDGLLSQNRSRDLFVQAQHDRIYTTSTKKNASTAVLIAELFALHETLGRAQRAAHFFRCVRSEFSLRRMIL